MVLTKKMFLEYDMMIYDNPENAFFNFLGKMEEERPYLKFVDDYWKVILEGVKEGVITKGLIAGFYNGLHARDKLKISKYLSLGSYARISKVFDVMLCVRTYMSVKVHSGRKVFKKEELEEYASLFFDTNGVFDDALEMLCVEGDMVYFKVSDNYHFSLIKSFKHHEGGFRTGFKTFVFGIFSEGNVQGVSEEVLLDLLGDNDIPFYKARTIFSCFRRSGLIYKKRKLCVLKEQPRFFKKEKEGFLKSLDLLTVFHKFTKETYESDTKKLLQKIGLSNTDNGLMSLKKKVFEKPEQKTVLFSHELLLLLRKGSVDREQYNSLKNKYGVSKEEADMVFSNLGTADIQVNEKDRVVYADYGILKELGGD